MRRCQLPQNWGRGGLLLLVFCVGCAPRPAKPPVEARNPQLSLALDMTPGAPKSYDPTVFTVRITDAAGKPVSRVAVTLRLDMPTMPMGRNEVAARETRAGVYVGTSRFTMVGAWRVTATAVKGPERATQAFPIVVR